MTEKSEINPYVEIPEETNVVVKNQNSLEIDKDFLLEKYKLRLDFYKFILGTVVLGVFSTIVTTIIQWKEIKLKQQDIEQKHFSQFKDDVMTKKLIERIRFAQYFSLLAPPDSKKAWEEYHKVLLKDFDNRKASLGSIEKNLEIIAERGNDASYTILINQLQKSKEEIESDLGLIPNILNTPYDIWIEKVRKKEPIVEGGTFLWAQAIVMKDGTVKPPTTTQVRENIEKMALELQKIQNQLNSQIEIVRWYYPVPINRRIGGNPDSHTTGQGVDIKVKGYTAKQLAAKLKDWPYGMGTHPNSFPDVLHLDMKEGKRRFGDIFNSQSDNP
ncbi:D-Ala-D-Ala carboxypeptidase family metallohydrolase [Anabaena sp. UHCC 0451]|uniref:D-Ala-D-Ala carboxypeptidase family metallohydrolase n=1 Tax=Anabaena sp. UHCC 0451 TaxID=2055235 RepID=UPI002B1FFC2A|nr:D-Ala-D-Ala carboxypeptidase family metallohydrolase [Anabaena sp. UHCC 0451]MEA5578672.1 D-Ala-D-Ala carboxypeptidase family metallohydrolase [Anabaena sp. UHCC 0451]